MHGGAVSVVVVVSVSTSLGDDGKQVTGTTYHGFHIGPLPCANDVGTGKRLKNSTRNKRRKKRQSKRERYEMLFHDSMGINLPLVMSQERPKQACMHLCLNRTRS